MTVYHNLKVSI